MVAALVLTGCDGDSAGPDQDPEPGLSPAPDGTGPDQTNAGATDDDADGEGTGGEDAGGEDAGGEDAGGTAPEAGDPDPDAPDLTDGPAWIDPEDQVEVAPGRDAIEVGQEITGIRIAGHEGFDRVVLDLTGDEVVLGWFGLYEDAPYEAGSGRPIDFAGNAVLSVPVEGIDWSNPHPDRTDGSDLGGSGGTGNAVEVVFGILFEGQQQVFVSVVDRTPYRIFPLNDPARIVIDVQHQ